MILVSGEFVDHNPRQRSLLHIVEGGLIDHIERSSPAEPRQERKPGFARTGAKDAEAVVCPAKAGMFSRGKACRGKNQGPRSLDSRVAGNQDSEAYRQRLPGGDDESPGRNDSERKSGLESE